MTKHTNNLNYTVDFKVSYSVSKHVNYQYHIYMLTKFHSQVNAQKKTT